MVSGLTWLGWYCGVLDFRFVISLCGCGCVDLGGIAIMVACRCELASGWRLLGVGLC